MIERRGETWIQIRDVDGDDERFDVLFWQAQGTEAIFNAAWELVVIGHEIKGLPRDELELQRSPVVVQPIRRTVSRRGRVRSDVLHSASVHEGP